MKRLKDLTPEELLAEDFDFESLVEIECAFQGIVTPVKPEYLPIPAVPGPDEEWCECHAHFFKTMEDAQAFLKTAFFTDYSTEDCPQSLVDSSYYGEIKSVRKYSPNLYRDTKTIRKTAKANKELNNDAESEYDKACEPYDQLKADLNEVIQKHREEKQRQGCQIKIFQSYVDLAEGSHKTALKFYENAYGTVPDYLIENFDLEYKLQENLTEPPDEELLTVSTHISDISEDEKAPF